MSSTIKLHRIITAPPERIYRAFITPEAISKWLPPHGFTATVHEFDPRVGGGFKVSFNNFTTGSSQTYKGTYTELRPNELIKFFEHFEDPNLAGEIPTSVNFQPVSCGTEVTVVQEGIPSAIPPEVCYVGWQQSLNLLALLVEPEIKEG